MNQDHETLALPSPVGERALLDVYGEGPARATLTAQAGQDRRVTFHGHSQQWRDSSDVLVSGCDVEAFGRTVVEAGLAGIPQVVPSRGGSAELVIDSVTGLRYDPDDIASLTGALARVVSWKSGEHRQYAAAARAHARRFDVTCCAAAYAGLAADLTPHRNQPIAA